MEKKLIKVKILDMEYEKEDYTLIMDILDIDKNEKVSLIMRAEDFKIPRKVKMPNGEIGDIPIDVMENFCEEMKGKEKNLFVEQDIYKGYSDEPSETEMLALQEDMDRYPYKELIRKKLNEG